MGRSSGSRNCKEELPFPGGIVEGEMLEGEMSTQFFNINAVKKDLQALCRGFGLASTGSKPQLQDRLRAFSSDREKWQMIAPGPRRTHRGPRTDRDAKAKPLKKSAQRAQELFDSTSTARLPHLPHQLPTQETPASQARSQEILRWARHISATSPNLNKEERRKAGEAQLQNAAAAPQSGNLRQLATYPSHTTGATNLASSNTLNYPYPQYPFTPLHPHGLVPFMSQSQLTLQPDLSQPAPQFTPNATTPSSTPSESAVMPTRSIKLGNGHILTFTADDVSPPPAVSFADDIPGLNRMWDDTSKHWGKHSVLTIKGIPIPIKYWKAVYGRSKSSRNSRSGMWKPGCWKQVKNHVSEWKSLVKRWRQSSEDDFWKEFSDDLGNRLSYTAIIGRIAVRQKEEDKRIATQAREYYGDQFGARFWYRKGGAICVKTKDHDIAEQYRRELANEAGIESDMDLYSD